MYFNHISKYYISASSVDTEKHGKVRVFIPLILVFFPTRLPQPAFISVGLPCFKLRERSNFGTW